MQEENKQPEIKQHPVQIQSKYSIIFVGETGAGKSSLINSLQTKQHLKTSKKMESCTKDIQYVISPFNGGRDEDTVMFVDTIGFCDTNKDKEVSNQLKLLNFLKLVKDGMNFIYFVIPLRYIRFDAILEFCIKLVVSIFGEEVKQYIRVVLTFASDFLPTVLEQRLQIFKEQFPIFAKKVGLEIKKDYIIYYSADEENMYGLQNMIDQVLKSDKKYSCQLLENIRQNIHLDFTNPIDLLKKMSETSKEFKQATKSLKRMEDQIRKLESELAEQKSKSRCNIF